MDRRIIADGTYFVATAECGLVGCGGWSKRMAVFGGDAARAGQDALLDPACDAARIRAFFTHPDWARRGIARELLAACESALVAAGFAKATLVATIAGEALYRACGYLEEERYAVPMGEGLTLPVVRMSKRFRAGAPSRLF